MSYKKVLKSDVLLWADLLEKLDDAIHECVVKQDQARLDKLVALKRNVFIEPEPGQDIALRDVERLYEEIVGETVR